MQILFILLAALLFISSGSLKKPKIFEIPQIQENYARSLEFASRIAPLKENHYLPKKKKLLRLAEKGLFLSQLGPKEKLRKICNRYREGRVLSKRVGIFKTERSVDKEALVWELAILLNSDPFIIPSLSFDIYGMHATFQPYMKVKTYERFLKMKTGAPKMSLGDFSILTLFTFLIGHGDLNGSNLHHKEKSFLLIDNDVIMPPSNAPSLSDEGRLIAPFPIALLDLDLAYVPFNEQVCQQIKVFQKDLQNKKGSIETFLLLSPLSQDLASSELHSFWERFELLATTKPKEGESLFEFIQYIFPQHFIKVDDLIAIESEILGFEVGPMTALHLASAYFPFWKISNDKKKRIDQWIKYRFSS